MLLDVISNIASGFPTILVWIFPTLDHLLLVEFVSFGGAGGAKSNSNLEATIQRLKGVTPSWPVQKWLAFLEVIFDGRLDQTDAPQKKGSRVHWVQPTVFLKLNQPESMTPSPSQETTILKLYESCHVTNLFCQPTKN